ncbi:MAG: SPOR domain-containing protein [Thermodesulfobacteriota bacterium]|nr:SPOR domain-containing protein [Thermodesulfobacteriota bacterium]
MRTTFLVVFFSLYLASPVLFYGSAVNCSHASEIYDFAEESPQSDFPNENLFRSRIYAVQASACRDEKNARKIQERLKDRGYTPNIYSWKDPSGRLWHSVFLGVYEDVTEARFVASRYREVEGKPVLVKTFALRVTEVEKITRRVTEVEKIKGHAPCESAEHMQTDTVVSCEEEVEPEVSQDFLDEDPKMYDEEEDTGPEFSCSGFIEFESFINTGRGGSFREKNKKNEIRNRFQMRYGTENLFLFSVSNVYMFQTYLNERAVDHYHYAKGQQVSRNLRLSLREAELSFNELYVNYGGENFRLRAGNQIYSWGTADVFNPTSYFNPSDMRELFFKDDDENKVGVPSLSGMFFLGDYTLETVFAPVHIPPIMAPEGNFWALSINGFSFDEPEQLNADIANVGYGARLSTSREGIDMSVSGYRGPDKDQIFRPYGLVVVPPEVTVLVKSQATVVTMFGLDASAALGDFVVQFEAAYSPDKVGVVQQDIEDFASPTFPFEIERAHCISYAAGFNYFIPMDKLIEGHTGDATFTFEWFKSQYLEDGLYAPPVTDIVSCKFQDSYSDGRVKTSVKGVFDMKHGGKMFWPKMGYDFQNGFLVEAGYVLIYVDKGSAWERNSIFYYFEDNDMLTLTVRYEY